jgi:hypothetical protein
MTDDDIAAAVADAIDPDAPDAAGKARLLAEILLGAALPAQMAEGGPPECWVGGVQVDPVTVRLTAGAPQPPP